MCCKLEYTLSELHRMVKKAGAEINISPEGISLWTSDASDYTCQNVPPAKALRAMSAIRRFRKYWRLP